MDKMLRTLLIDTARLSLWLTLLTVVFVPLERLFALHPARVPDGGVEPTSATTS